MLPLYLDYSYSHLTDDDETHKQQADQVPQQTVDPGGARAHFEPRDTKTRMAKNPKRLTLNLKP